MKPFFSIDWTKNNKNTERNGREFLAAEPSLLMSASLDNSAGEVNEVMEKSKLPLAIRIAQWVFGFIAITFAGGILDSLGEVSFAEGYKNAPALIWICGAAFVIWVMLTIIAYKKKKTVLESDESTMIISHLENNIGAAFEELSVPLDARDVDILWFYYKEKDGKIKLKGKALQLAAYFNNPIFKAFSDPDNLYLACTEGKYAFPKQDMLALRKVNKRINFSSWNKDVSFKDEEYKEYKLSCDNYGRIHCKYYGILEVKKDEETFGIYIPCYELPVIEDLTGLRAEEAS